MTDATERPRPGGARRAPRSVRLSRRERRAQERMQVRGGRRALRAPTTGGVRRASRSRLDEATRSGGRRALRRPRRRTRGLPGTLGWTFLGAVVPGSGYLFAGRRLLGWVLVLGWLSIVGALGWYFGRDWHRAVDIAFDATALKTAAAVMATLLLIWLGVVWTSYRMLRPRERPPWHTAVGNVAVVVICLVVAAPVLRAAQYALATADLVTTVLDGNSTATAPDVDEQDPWADRERVSVLLLGGDGGEGREGVRTDSVILLSIDTETGKAVTFSLPRNLAAARFPEESPLAELYPEGYTNGDPADGNYMLNAVYRNIPAAHPGILGKSSNEGADAVKQAVEGTLGIPVDYYVLVNLEGFKEVVDAMGGVTVNVNEPIAIGGNTTANIPPDDYLAPGPDQHLDGFHALWYARGRWGSDDYERMDRQRCMVDALVESADPAGLLLRYLDLVKAGKEIVYTDIPSKLGSAFVDLALRVKDASVRSVVFKTSDEFSSAAPDIEYLHAAVQRAIAPPRRTAPAAGEGTTGADSPKSPDTGAGGSSAADDGADDAVDACSYQPTGETVEDALAADAAY